MEMLLINDPNFSAQKLWKHNSGREWHLRPLVQPLAESLSVWWWKITALWHPDSQTHRRAFHFVTKRLGLESERFIGMSDRHPPRSTSPPPPVAPNIWWYVKTQSWEENVFPRAEKFPATPQRCRCSSKSSRVIHVCCFIRKKEESAARIRWWQQNRRLTGWNCFFSMVWRHKGNI